jgi:hypothetical protein
MQMLYPDINEFCASVICQFWNRSGRFDAFCKAQGTLRVNAMPHCGDRSKGTRVRAAFRPELLYLNVKLSRFFFGQIEEALWLEPLQFASDAKIASGLSSASQSLLFASNRLWRSRLGTR